VTLPRPTQTGQPPLHTPGPPIDRCALIAGITTFLAGHDPRTLNGIRRALGRELDVAGPDAIACLGERLAGAAADWNYYPRDELARRIHHLLADRLLTDNSALSGVDHLTAVADSPVVIFANHLSYSDANLLEVLLHRAGATALVRS
jgi:hypothetical protein